MEKEFVARNRPVFDELHPKVYGASVALIVWFLLMAWILFDRSSDVSLSLMFVTVLFAVAIALPWTLSLVWRKSQKLQQPHSEPTSFHDWKEGYLAVWGARLRTRDAVIDCLLPLMAVSFGLTGIGIVFVIVRAFAA